MARSDVWRLVAVVLVCVAMTTDLRLREPEVSEVIPEVERQRARPEICRELLVPHEDLTWDEEQEEYVPINWDWRECMGVGRQ